MTKITKELGTNSKTGLNLEAHFTSLTVGIDTITLTSKEVELDLEGNPYKAEHAGSFTIEASGEGKVNPNPAMAAPVGGTNLKLTPEETEANKQILTRLKADILGLVTGAYNALTLKTNS